MATIDDEKRALRALVRARMPRSGSPEQVAASVAAQDRLAASDLAQGARMIALYRALPSECGTAALAARLEAAGRVLRVADAVVEAVLAAQARDDLQHRVPARPAHDVADEEDLHARISRASVQMALTGRSWSPSGTRGTSCDSKTSAMDVARQAARVAS